MRGKVHRSSCHRGCVRRSPPAYMRGKETLACEKEEHKHTLQCYSDPKADVETAPGWERTLENVRLTGNWNNDVLAIAQTQIGYEESTQNYEVQEDGTSVKGITRYGQWYGIPYSARPALVSVPSLNEKDDSWQYDVIVYVKPGVKPTPAPTPTTTPAPRPLPQTGQLWWPVPVLVCGGLFLVLIGVVKRRSSKDET